MRRFLSIMITLVWGLWFGGLIVLFLAVTTLFRTFTDPHALSAFADAGVGWVHTPAEGRQLAGQGAAEMFHLFNEYQLTLAAAALVATFCWRVLGPPRLKEALFTLFALATLAGCIVTMYLSPRMEALQRQGLTHTPQFARLHGRSMMAYTAQVALLLIAGIMLPWINDPRADRREPSGIA